MTDNRKELTGHQWRKVTRPEILRRDHYMCMICGRPLDMNAKPGSRWAPSVDHIVPVSLGGTDHPENLRAAHFGCNSSRQAGRPPNRTSRPW